MKYYVIHAQVAEAISDVGINVMDLTDETFIELSVVYKKAEFIEAFNNNILAPATEYLRIL